MPRHERRAGDDEAERDEAGADLKQARADRLVKDKDAADDGREVGRHRSERDHLDSRPELEAASGGEEGDRVRDERRERPRAQQPVQRALGVREELDRDVRDAEQRPGTEAEEQSLGRRRTLRCAETAKTAAATATIAPSTAIIAASDDCCGLVAPPPVNPITASPAPVIVTPIHCHRPRRKPK